MIRKYYEIRCDECGCAEHFLADIGIPCETQARAHGWIVTGKRIHFDLDECYKKYMEKEKSEREM